MKRTTWLALATIVALLASACSGSAEAEAVDRSSPEDVVAAVVSLAADGNINGACLLVDEDPEDCAENLEQAVERWRSGDHLDAMRELSAEDVSYSEHSGLATVEAPGVVPVLPWKPGMVETDDGWLLGSTHYLGDTD